ncbi:Alpha/Beta hydrolase protein [Mycena galopus ATCC 62051]|nr:Alpha/Beta hydrolase protein [Mycena galopus ATCC 62051]
MESSHTIATAPGTTLQVLTSVPSTRSSKPTLVFVHFWGGSRRTFGALAARLRTDFPLILPALRGWGGSTGPDDADAYKVTDNANDLAALVACLQADEALVAAGLFQHGLILVGHSMGAKIAQVLAARGDLGALLKGLVLIGPAPVGKLELPAEMREQQMTAYSSRESAELALKYVMLGSDVGADEVRLLVDDCVGGNEHAKMAWPKYGTREDYEVLLAAASLKIPVAVVVGSLDKIETAERVDEKVVRVLEKAGAFVKVAVIQDAGHLMPVEASGKLEEIIQSSSSRSARQDKAKTAKIKVEKEGAAAASLLHIQNLQGDAPPCEVPSSFAVDHEEQILFFNTYDDPSADEGGKMDKIQKSEIFSCDLKTKTWKNLTEAIRHLPHPIGAPERFQQLPARYGGAMAYYKVKASGQRLLLLFGGQLDGLNEQASGDTSNELLAIDVDHLKWWVVEVAGGPVAARAAARLVIVDDQLFIFGGETQQQSNESYSVASFANHRWTWDVRDEPYPADVPALGSSCDAVTIQDGDTQKILLTVGCIDGEETAVDLAPTSFVLFDIGLRTFTPQVADSGNFPRIVTWYGISNLPGSLKSDPSATSAIICTFYEDSTPKPELYIYSLSPQGGCKCLGLRKRIAATAGTYEFFAAVGSKMYLFGWTKTNTWDIMVEIPQRWISA